MIRLDQVHFRYPKAAADALDGVSLEISEGGFYAFLGPNGAGKTTLLRLLCGRFSKFEGTLQIDANYRDAKGYLDPLSYGVLLENPGIYPKLSIREYVDFFLGIYAQRLPNWNPIFARERVNSLAKKLELPSLDFKMGKLSLGNRQKVQLLRALAPSPRLLILDEPVANLDPLSREMVWNLLGRWRKEEGGTAIVCSHILAEMEAEATDYAIIDKGRVLRSGRVMELSAEMMSFHVEVPGEISMAQVREAFSTAHIDAKVVAVPTGLADLYRRTILGNL